MKKKKSLLESGTKNNRNLFKIDQDGGSEYGMWDQLEMVNGFL